MGLLDEMKLVRKVKSVAQNVVDENKGSEPMWATVRAVDGTTGRPTVEVDGGELVECASWANECFVGDRVMIEVRNHQVNQVNNATNKSVGKARLDILENSIEAEISDLDEGLRTLITATVDGVLTAVSLAIQSTTQLWFAKATSAKPGRPYSEITQDQNVYVEWTSAVPTYNASYPYYFYCYQYMLADGSFEWSDVVYDSTIKDAESAAAAAATAAANAAAAAADAQDTADDAKETADWLSTMVREYRDGVLVCKTNRSVGALVNADGSFDVVKLTWNGDTPTAGNKISSFSEDSVDFYNGDSESFASLARYSSSGALGYTLHAASETTFRSGLYSYVSSSMSYSELRSIAKTGPIGSAVQTYSFLNSTNDNKVVLQTMGETFPGSGATTISTLTVSPSNVNVSKNLTVDGNLSVSGTMPSHQHSASDINSGTLAAARIPDLGAGKITSGTFAAARIPELGAGKITSGTFDSARIPSLDASKIGSGSFAAARIPSLDASKIGSGTFGAARLPKLFKTLKPSAVTISNIASGSSGNTTISISPGSDYSPVAIAWIESGANAPIVDCRINSRTSVYVRVRNVSSSSISPDVRIGVLCVLTSLLDSNALY